MLQSLTPFCLTFSQNCGFVLHFVTLPLILVYALWVILPEETLHEWWVYQVCSIFSCCIFARAGCYVVAVMPVFLTASEPIHSILIGMLLTTQTGLGPSTYLQQFSVLAWVFSFWMEPWMYWSLPNLIRSIPYGTNIQGLVGSRRGQTPRMATHQDNKSKFLFLH